jgi:hypothetical protein
VKVRIVIQSDEIGSLDGEIETENNPTTARLSAEALPIEAGGDTWGDEIYFSIPVDTGTENPSEVVQEGDLAYWPPGNAFCIFFGRTPASKGDEIRPASEVNVFGRVQGDLNPLRSFTSGSSIRIAKASPDQSS